MSGWGFSNIARIVVGGSEQFRRNFIGMAVANTLAQAVGVLALPILSRTFTPADFGVLAIFVSLHAMLVAVVTGRFDWLMPNAHEKAVAAGIFALGLICTFLVTLVTALAMGGFAQPIAVWVGIPSPDAWLLWFMPIAVAVGGIQLLLWAWHVFGGDLKAVSVSRVTQALVTLLVSVAAGLFGMGAMGLILGFLAGFILSLPVLLLGDRELASLLVFRRSLGLKELLRRYWREAAASLAVSIVNTAVVVSIPVLLAQHYNATVVGWYGLVMRAATAPIGFVTNAITHSFWADAARLAKEDPARLRGFYLQSVLRLSIMAIPVILVCLAAPLYIGPIFGRDQWEGAGRLLAAVTPYLYAIIAIGPTTHLMVYGRQNWQFWSDLGMLTLAAALVFAIATANGEAWQAVLAASTVYLIGYLIRFWLHLVAIDCLVKARAQQD